MIKLAHYVTCVTGVKQKKIIRHTPTDESFTLGPLMRVKPDPPPCNKRNKNIFKKDIQRHLKENMHLKSCCNWKMFLCTIDWCKMLIDWMR